jgi:hypothetical protein
MITACRQVGLLSWGSDEAEGVIRSQGHCRLPPSGTAKTLHPRQKAAAILRRNKIVINTYSDLRRTALNTHLTKNDGPRVRGSVQVGSTRMGPQPAW